MLKRLEVKAAPDQSRSDEQAEGTWFNFGDAPSLEEDSKTHWEFQTGFWSSEGLRATNKKTGEVVRFSYETPFGAWTARNAVQLPGDKVLFQLEHDQICVFDTVGRRVALLWHGRGPVAVVEGVTTKSQPHQ